MKGIDRAKYGPKRGGYRPPAPPHFFLIFACGGRSARHLVIPTPRDRQDPDVPADVHELLHKWLRHDERWAERTRQVLLSTVRSKKGGLVPKKGGLIPKKKDFFLINLGQSSSTCTP